jgi:hypothetical protein
MKRNKAVDFLTVTLFFGILLSYTIYIGIDVLVHFKDDNFTENANKSGFNGMFYEDDNLDAFVKSLDYKMFGYTGNTNIIVGKDDWLFEVRDSQSGYERLLDYVGGSEFSAEQLENAHMNIVLEQNYYKAVNAEYMLVVVPDSMTVCADKLPSYLGKQSDNTRREMLVRYLAERGNGAFVDPTSSLIEANNEVYTYDNTENSVNAFGAYIIYSNIMQNVSADLDASFVDRDQVEFFVRNTEGKAVAVSAGLDKTVKNKTVSLTDKAEYNYKVIASAKNKIVTRMPEPTNGTRVVVECADDWVRTQLTPYLSNTFYEVVYTSNADVTRAEADKNGTSLVIRIMHEGELGALTK